MLQRSRGSLFRVGLRWPECLVRDFLLCVGHIRIKRFECVEQRLAAVRVGLGYFGPRTQVVDGGFLFGVFMPLFKKGVDGFGIAAHRIRHFRPFFFFCRRDLEFRVQGLYAVLHGFNVS